MYHFSELMREKYCENCPHFFGYWQVGYQDSWYCKMGCFKSYYFFKPGEKFVMSDVNVDINLDKCAHLVEISVDDKTFNSLRS